MLIKRSMTIAGHRTSLALEEEFWAVLDDCARHQNISLPVLIANIDTSRARADAKRPLASAVRVYALHARRH